MLPLRGFGLNHIAVVFVEETFADVIRLSGGGLDASDHGRPREWEFLQSRRQGLIDIVLRPELDNITPRSRKHWLVARDFPATRERTKPASAKTAVEDLFDLTLSGKGGPLAFFEFD
ncbi:hypothetical protein HPP92_028836 [Vanilla planifolia]|uniref:Uncharacterized protein n=1 Tax=Vanilla planifolia TaxID=51239 RepID=A0A835P5W9_VANPL|nr:hypothetical protein HPP92_028836 [Vanilla planifolia]KAG0446458.1 hypothetical protein HPP92_028825 [Vanilla planifolia]